MLSKNEIGNIKEKLAEKAEHEYQKYCADLLSQRPIDILQASDKSSFMLNVNQILSMKKSDIKDEVAVELYKQDNPLEYLYNMQLSMPDGYIAEHGPTKNIENYINDVFANFEEEKQRVFVDMDGVLAVFNSLASEEELYKKGYFANLPCQDNILCAVEKLCNNENFDVYILSSYLEDSPYALSEKKAWLKQCGLHFLIDDSHQIFVPCGEKKSSYVPGGVKPADILIDDYGVNIDDWKEACSDAVCVKVCKNKKDIMKTQKRKGYSKMSLISEESGVDFIYDNICFFRNTFINTKKEERIPSIEEITESDLVIWDGNNKSEDRGMSR